MANVWTGPVEFVVEQFDSWNVAWFARPVAAISLRRHLREEELFASLVCHVEGLAQHLNHRTGAVPPKQREVYPAQVLILLVNLPHALH